MREPLEMVTASRMQNMVEINKKNICFVSILSYYVRPVLIVSCAVLIRTVLAPTLEPFGRMVWSLCLLHTKTRSRML